MGPEGCTMLANSVPYSIPGRRITNPCAAPSARVRSSQQKNSTRQLRKVKCRNTKSGNGLQLSRIQLPHKIPQGSFRAKRNRASSTKCNWTLEAAHDPGLHENQSETLVLLKPIGLFQLMLLEMKFHSKKFP